MSATSPIGPVAPRKIVALLNLRREWGTERRVVASISAVVPRTFGSARPDAWSRLGPVVRAAAAPPRPATASESAPVDLGRGSPTAAAKRTFRPVMSDEDSLVTRAAAGDREAFRVLYTRHRADVARLVYRMIGRPSDLDDVVQEVFFQVHKSLPDFRGQAKFSTWLHRVTVNVVLMHRRAAKSRPVLVEEPVADLTEDAARVLPDEEVARRDRVRAFSRVLDRIADKKRVVFVLHELEGVTPAEIAEIVGAPVLTVRTRLFYARREIEALLREEPALASLLDELGAKPEPAASKTKSEKTAPLAPSEGEATRELDGES